MYFKPMFGRLPAHGLGNDRDAEHPMRAALMDAPVVLPKTKYWAFFNEALNQWYTGTCVGHGGEGWLLAGPIIQKRKGAFPDAYALYRRAIAVDEWTENDAEINLESSLLVFGTSVRALFKVLQELGYVREYVWAQTLTDIQEFVSLKGPVVIGVNWYEGMMATDVDGYLNLTGRVAGGHCVLVIGVDNVKRRFRILNSWGKWWGQSGRAWVRFEDMERLVFHEGGEAAAGIETRIPLTTRVMSTIRHLLHV
jgi:hypothetical protein